jgi:hypothetical protein
VDFVMPAKAGIQGAFGNASGLDSRLRGNDKKSPVMI